jgi:hypothetical protein
MSTGYPLGTDPHPEREAQMIANEDVVPGAGKVHLKPAEPWGKGIIREIKETLVAHWFKEMINFNQKTIAVSFLMFISISPPTLSFGSSYGKMSGNKMGAIETILATSWVGCTYALFSGMPVAIIGSTGPALAIMTAIKNMSDGMGCEYLAFNAWVSIWVFIYCFLCAFFDITRYIKLATRFTDDIFALLIVVIFVVKALGDPFPGGSAGLFRYLDEAHKSHGKHADAEDYQYQTVAFLSIILGFGTTATIFWLRGFKFSPYFCADVVRSSISDFAVTTSVIIFSCIKEFGFPEIATEQLNVPDTFEPTYQCCTSACENFWPDECPEIEASAGARPWFVDMGNIPVWAPFAAAGPAIMGFLLVYLDDGITWHLVNQPHNKLQHGESYNYDIILVGGMNMVNSFLGAPWLVATTVPCIVHLNALAERDTKGDVIEVQETRLTGFFAHFLLGITLVALKVLNLIPVPLLSGVFLFMGLSALPSMQLWNRMLMFFQQPSKIFEICYTKWMDLKRIHMFTCFQLVFFFGIFVVMNIKTISIAFPFMTFLCIPGRLFLAPKFFAGWELCLLDGEEDDVNEWLEAKELSMRGFKPGDKTKQISEGDEDSASVVEPVEPVDFKDVESEYDV